MKKLPGLLLSFFGQADTRVKKIEHFDDCAEGKVLEFPLIEDVIYEKSMQRRVVFRM